MMPLKPPAVRPGDKGWQPVLASTPHARSYAMLTGEEKREICAQWRGSSFYPQIDFHHWIHMDMLKKGG